MDSAVERAQQLIKGAMTNRSSQISELGMKYQQVSHKVKVSSAHISVAALRVMRISTDGGGPL